MTDGSLKTFERTEILLGEGGQGKVYLAIDSELQEYVVKIFDFSTRTEKDRKFLMKDYERELGLLKKIDSPFVIKFYGHASDPDSKRHYLLLEFCNCDLQKVIDYQKLILGKAIFPDK